MLLYFEIHKALRVAYDEWCLDHQSSSRAGDELYMVCDYKIQLIVFETLLQSAARVEVLQHSITELLRILHLASFELFPAGEGHLRKIRELVDDSRF